MEENRECRKFGHLLETRINSLCQIGALTSESFSEQMISAANLLVDTHRIRLHCYNIDKMVVLHASKRFMERLRRKEAFTSIVFHYVLSDENASANKECNYYKTHAILRG